ncbi:hypothetical protein PG997_008791 [Apiospora hydei]|uniref:Uncharacterized protein n=1 Tax=Apiospora hydei TaxID=1337664 RepID=A0ABR1WFV1_9PEZI
MPQLIPQQVNGVRRVNGDNTVPRHGAAVRVPSNINDPPAIAHHGMDPANSPAAYVTQAPRFLEPAMHQSAMMRTASSTNNNTPPRSEATPSPSWPAHHLLWS